MKTNPFRYGQVVTGEYFTDREEEIRCLSEAVISGQSIILISPRRYGKTSAVMNAVKNLDYPFIKIDMQLITDEVDLGNTLLRKLFSLSRFEKIKYYLKNLRVQPSIQVDPHSNEISVVLGPREKKAALYLEDALEMPERIGKSLKKRLIIVFDEFQDIRRSSKNLEKKMRAVFQHHNEVSYVFIGSQEHMIRDIFENKNNPFYRFGKQVVLTEIMPEKIKCFIIDRFADRGLNAVRIADRIVEITGGHPYYTQQLCHEIFIVNEGKKVTGKAVEKAIQSILTNHDADYQKWWNNLDNTERKVIVGLCGGLKNPTSNEFINAVGINSASTSGSAVKRLLEKEILIKENGNGCAIEDPFWMRWVVLNRK